MKRFTILVKLLVIVGFVQAQIVKVSAIQEKSSISVTGTSTLHDWEMKLNKMQSSFNYSTIDETKVEIVDTRLSIKTEDLKSNNSGLDSKAYEALKSDKYATMTFTQNEKITVALLNKKFKSKIYGNLNIAGTSKLVEVEFAGELLPDGTIKIIGEKDLKMTLFNIPPPKAMFGTIKSGDDIMIKFNLIFK